MRRRRSGLLQFEDLRPTYDAAEWQGALSDGRLDRLDEAETADDAMAARLRLHRRLGRQADDALYTDTDTRRHAHQIKFSVAISSELTLLCM